MFNLFKNPFTLFWSAFSSTKSSNQPTPAAPYKAEPAVATDVTNNQLANISQPTASVAVDPPVKKPRKLARPQGNKSNNNAPVKRGRKPKAS